MSGLLLRCAVGLAATSCIAVLVSSCSLGEGAGNVDGTIDIADCWSGHFELKPDFFAAVPYGNNNTMQLRIQNGGDYETFSDGVIIIIDNIQTIRNELGQPLQVDLPPSVKPPGVPITAVANPSIVHLSLYLQKTCRTQGVALYALGSASLNGDGTCGGTTDGGGSSTIVAESCGAGGTGLAADASVPTFVDAGASSLPIGQSTITFQHLFNGNPNETDAAERLTEGSFDVVLADPRNICPGGFGPPAACQGHLTGSFKFYFERGRPAQPFP
ncbi:MAG: hypothetical protein ABI461_23525 [Polyangiaceae bacterium]